MREYIFKVLKEKHVMWNAMFSKIYFNNEDDIKTLSDKS